MHPRIRFTMGEIPKALVHLDGSRLAGNNRARACTGVHGRAASSGPRSSPALLLMLSSLRLFGAFLWTWGGEVTDKDECHFF